MIWYASLETVEVSSASTPLRSTRNCRGSPLPANTAFKPFGQRHRRNQHGDGQADADRGHQRRAFALDEVADVVVDRNAHDRFIPVNRSDSTTFFRAATIAGTNAAKQPMTAAIAKHDQRRLPLDARESKPPPADSIALRQQRPDPQAHHPADQADQHRFAQHELKNLARRVAQRSRIAISRVRSRTAIATVLAETSRIVNVTAAQIAARNNLMFPRNARNDRPNSFSDSVRVG